MRISATFRNLPLREALRQIEQTGGFLFVYSKNQIDDSRPVNTRVVNETVEQVLVRLFAHTQVRFRQAGNNIILSLRPEAKRTVPSGIIEGTVRDYNTGEDLVGATVVVDGTKLGTTADGNGRFRIAAVPEGVHSLIFSFIGYHVSKVSGVQVKGGMVTRVEHKLVAASNVLNEIQIVARPDVRPEITTERLLVNEIRNSRNIVTGISTEQITRSLDFDANEVVRRGTGVSLVSGRFVMLRGLDPRYTLTMLNDMITPSSENDRKAFSYDMINSSTIDRILISKSPAPELPGDFGGGVVKVYTKSFANARQLQIQVFGQFRPLSSFANHYTYEGGRYDRLGFDDGTRARPPVPSASSINTFPDGRSTDPAVQAENARLSRLFPNNWNLQQRHQNMDKRVIVNYYDGWNIGKTRLSSLTSIAYFLTADFRRITGESGAIRQLTAQDGSGGRFFIPPGQTVTDSVYTETARVSAMQNFRWRINDRHTVEFRNFFNLLGQDETTVRESRSSAETPQDYYQFLNKGVQYNFRSRALYTGVLSGEHQLDKSGATKLSWRVGYARTTENVPDQRRYGFLRRDTLPGTANFFRLIGAQQTPIPPNDPPGNYRWQASDGGRTTDARFYSTLEESAYTASADAERDFGRFLAKIGWFSDYRERAFTTDIYGIFFNTQLVLADDLRRFYSQTSEAGVPGLDRNAERLFNPRNFRPDGSGWKMNADLNENRPSVYTASNEQHAGYVAVNLPLLKKRLNIYGGVRGEWNRLLSRGNPFTTVNIDSIPTTNQVRLYWLPSVNVSYKVFPKHLVRVAYGLTLNRPEFREVSPVQYYDFINRTFVVGNPGITNAEIRNMETRWEWYPQEDELVSLGVFYKDLRNPIEIGSLAAGNFTNDQISYVNTSRAEVYGVELEVRKRLDFVPSAVFRHLSVIGNLTLLQSRVQVNDTLRSLTQGAYPDERPLQGAAPYTVNAGVYYDNSEKGTQASLLYNVLGPRLSAAATVLTSYALYEAPRHVIDFAVTQRVNRFLQIKAGVQDLLNQPFRFFRDVVPDQRFSTNVGQGILGGVSSGQPLEAELTRDFLEQSYRPGSYYTLGLLFTF
ncbi:MAG: TonB-dependent receptor [Cytophagales bacterium]|nr:TonB-dependent receptor [Cytophagales bacterium]